MKDCTFCNIIAGEYESSIVHKDDLCTAFMDIQPVNEGHLLVVPNEHADDLAELPKETGAQIFRIAQNLSEKIYKSKIRSDGINFILADGTAAGQEIFHIHLHVIPRFKGDGFSIRFSDSYFIKPPRSVLDSAAEKINAVSIS